MYHIYFRFHYQKVDHEIGYSSCIRCLHQINTFSQIKNTMISASPSSNNASDNTATLAIIQGTLICILFRYDKVIKHKYRSRAIRNISD